uniref:Uncharacterized protein n=1 Tax=Panagrolaimus sp. ES5 TaxID=591445 RepID=A0AC34FE07_9BILA
MAEKILDILKTEKLFTCYEALAKCTITEKNLPGLIKLLKSIVIRTEAYICTITSDNEDTALKMKENCDRFLKKLSFYNTQEILTLTEEFENLWKVVQQFYDIGHKSDIIEKHSHDVASAIDWFKKNSVELFTNEKQTHIKSIKETLQNTTENYYFIDKLPQFIYNTILFITNEALLSKWKRKMYIYDSGKKCCVAFYIEDNSFGKYYLDQYGNLYLSEIQFLQTLRKCYGFYDFTDADENLYNVKHLYDEDFLEIILETFQRLIENFDSFKKNLGVLNSSKINYHTPYSNIVAHIMVPFGVKLNPFPLEVYQKQINKLSKVREESFDDMDVVHEFEQNEQNVKNEFCSFMEAIMTCEKSNSHKFSNDFAAVYYFSKHYNSISETLQTNKDEFTKTNPLPLNLPKLNETNMKECATFYLKFLPDFVFNEKFCVKSFNTDPAKQDAVVKWQLFERGSIKGIKCTLRNNGSTFIGDLCAAKELFDFDNDSGVGSSVASSSRFGSDIETEIKFLSDF